MAKLDHVGITVKDAEKVISMLKDLVDFEQGFAEAISSQKLVAHFLPAGETALELLEATDASSPIAAALEKRGEGVHHLAFKVPDIQSLWHRCIQRGYAPLGEGPQPGARGKQVFFLHPRDTHGMLIEFCQATPLILEPASIPYRRGSIAGYAAGPREKPSLLVLHGAAGCTHLETAPLIRRLATTYRVYAMDFPGHGHSSAFEDEPFTAALFLQSIPALLDHYGVEKTHIFGFSMGGGLALQMAATFPTRVDKLAVHAANLKWNEPDTNAMLERLDSEAIMAQTPGLGFVLEELHVSGWTSLFERMQAYVKDVLATPNQTAALAKIHHPVLVSATDRDDYFSLEAPLAIHEALPNSNLAILPGTKHALQNLVLDTYLPLLRRHLDLHPLGLLRKKVQ